MDAVCRIDQDVPDHLTAKHRCAHLVSQVCLLNPAQLMIMRSLCLTQDAVSGVPGRPCSPAGHAYAMLSTSRSERCLATPAHCFVKRFMYSST